MATSPILLNTIPFDATKEHKLHFTYNGSQIFAHKIIVKQNDTNTVVYNKKIAAMNTIISIPANTLKNGVTYNFQVSVFDHEDKESPLSNPIILKCLATPTFEFSNIIEGTIVRNSYVDVELKYAQENGELLNEYTIYLYAHNQTTILYSTGTRYSSDTLSARIPELMDDTTYYLYATGETLNGMEIHTEYVQIVCDYIKPDIFLKFRADNIPEEGIVRLTSNFVLIEGNSIPDPESLIYIDNEKVSLINGEKVFFDKGWKADNFTLDMILTDPIDFSKLVSFNMKTALADVMWNYGIFEGDEEATYYAELRAYEYIGSEKLNYVQISNRIAKVPKGESIHFWIRHVDGTFDIQIAKYVPQENIKGDGVV